MQVRINSIIQIYICYQSSSVSAQLKLRSWIIKKYCKKFAVIVLNGQNSKLEKSGLTLFHHTLIEPIENVPLSHRRSNGEHVTLSSTINSEIHSFAPKKYGVSHVLDYLRLNGGVEKFPNIIIISGYLAGRSISFTSGSCIGETMGWH